MATKTMPAMPTMPAKPKGGKSMLPAVKNPVTTAVLPAPHYVDREAKMANYTPTGGTLTSARLTNDKGSLKGDPTNPQGTAKPARKRA